MSFSTCLGPWIKVNNKCPVCRDEVYPERDPQPEAIEVDSEAFEEQMEILIDIEQNDDEDYEPEAIDVEIQDELDFQRAVDLSDDGSEMDPEFVRAESSHENSDYIIFDENSHGEAEYEPITINEEEDKNEFVVLDEPSSNDEDYVPDMPDSPNSSVITLSEPSEGDFDPIEIASESDEDWTPE